MPLEGSKMPTATESDEEEGGEPSGECARGDGEAGTGNGGPNIYWLHVEVGSACLFMLSQVGLNALNGAFSMRTAAHCSSPASLSVLQLTCSLPYLSLIHLFHIFLPQPHHLLSTIRHPLDACAGCRGLRGDNSNFA